MRLTLVHPCSSRARGKDNPQHVDAYWFRTVFLSLISGVEMLPAKQLILQGHVATLIIRSFLNSGNIKVASPRWRD